MYLSRRRRDTEKDNRGKLRELRGSARGNLTCYLIGIYEYAKTRSSIKNKKLSDSIMKRFGDSFLHDLHALHG